MLPNNKCKNKISFDIKILNSNSKKNIQFVQMAQNK